MTTTLMPLRRKKIDRRMSGKQLYALAWLLTQSVTFTLPEALILVLSVVGMAFDEIVSWTSWSQDAIGKHIKDIHSKVATLIGHSRRQVGELQKALPSPNRHGQYNGYMGAKEKQEASQSVAEVEIAHILAATLRRLPLNSHKPQYVVVNTETGEIYLSGKDTAEIFGVVPGQVRLLVSEGKLNGVVPGGLERFISSESIRDHYKNRKPPGRPRKDSS